MMRFLKRFTQGELRLNRVEAFSDGVFAIVVTLLVLELKVPILRNHSSASELGHQLVNLVPKFLSWLISFIIVCKFWLNHHHLLTFARHATYGMIWLNSIFLMGQAFIPFPTALMGEYPMNPLAVSLFGIVMAANTLLFIALQSYTLRNLIKPEMMGAVVPHLTRKSFVGVISYLLGVAATLFNVHIAFVLYALTPLFFITPPQPRRHSPKKTHWRIRLFKAQYR
jgi:TMEM175 potassium channel family protein